MDYAFKSEKVESIISAPLTESEHFLPLQHKAGKSNLLTLGVCRHDNVTFVWRGQLSFCTDSAFLPSFSSSSLPLSSFFFPPSTPSYHLRRCSTSPLFTQLLLFFLPTLSCIHYLIIFSSCSIFCSSQLSIPLSLSAWPCHFSMREQTLL